MFGRGPLANRARQRVSRTEESGSVGYEGGGSVAKGRVGAGLRKVGASRLGKVGRVPQYLLGPRSFPLDRLLAIFQSVLVEHGRGLLEEELGLGEDVDDDEEDEEDDAMDVDDEEGGADGSPSRTPHGFNFDDVTVEDRRKAQRQREREQERTYDWEDDVEDLSRSIGLFGIVSVLSVLI